MDTIFMNSELDGVNAGSSKYTIFQIFKEVAF